MHAKLLIDLHYDVLVLQVAGEATHHAMCGVRSALDDAVERSPALHAPYRLIDLSACSLRVLSREQLIAAVRGLSQWRIAPDARRAFVAPRNASQTEWRIFDAYAAFVGHRMQVLRGIASACDWLGLPSSYSERMRDGDFRVLALCDAPDSGFRSSSPL